MFALLKTHRNRVRARQEALKQESTDLEEELYDVKNFLMAAPALREEARLLVPPPDDLLVHLPDTPNRSDLARVQRQSFLNGIKLFAMLMIFIAVALWFVDRFVRLSL